MFDIVAVLHCIMEEQAEHDLLCLIFINLRLGFCI